MNILVVEPSASGHHFALYGKLVVRALLEEGHSVFFLTTKEAVKNVSFDEIKNEVVGYESNFFLRYMRNVAKPTSNSSYQLLKFQFRTYVSMKKSYKKVFSGSSIGHVFLINIDHIDKVLPVLGSPFGKTHFSGILMSIKFHINKMGLGAPSRSDFIYSILFSMTNRIKSLKKIGVVDEVFYKYFRDNNLNANKLSYIPDPVIMDLQIEKEDARKALGMPTESKVILIYGSVTERKGVKEAVAVILAAENKDISLLIAGKFSKEVCEFLSSAVCNTLADNGRLFKYDKFHGKEEESVVFSASDIVWLGYKSNFVGSSGVLYQAGEYGLPVVARKSGLISWLTAKYDLGVICNPDDVKETAKALEKIVEDKKWMEEKRLNCQFLASSHSSRNFEKGVISLVS